MAYAEKQIVNLNETALTLASTGVKARWTPGVQGGTIRRWGLQLEAATSVTAAVVVLKKRPTPGSATGEVVLQSLTLATAEAAGNTVYGNDLQAQILPGEQVIIEVTTAATGGATTFAFLEFDPDWEVPGNAKASVINRMTP